MSDVKQDLDETGEIVYTLKLPLDPQKIVRFRHLTTHYLVQQLIYSLYGRELFIHPFDVGFVGRHGITVSFRQKDDQETGHE